MKKTLLINEKNQLLWTFQTQCYFRYLNILAEFEHKFKTVHTMYVQQKFYILYPRWSLLAYILLTSPFFTDLYFLILYFLNEGVMWWAENMQST